MLLARNETNRIRTLVADSISYNNNRYDKHASYLQM